MKFLSISLSLTLSVVTVYASVLEQPTLPLANATFLGDNLTSPGGELQSIPPIRLGLNLSTAQITGWDLYPVQAFLYVKRFSEESVDSDLMLYFFEKASGGLPSGPLKNGRFSLSFHGGWFIQIIANKESPFWQSLSGPTVRWIYNVFQYAAFNPRNSVLYADIFSLEYDARGGPPIGYLMIDNRPPPGWIPENSVTAVN